MSNALKQFISPETEDLVLILEPKLEQMKNHEVFSMVKTIEDVRTFMQWHVYAVWDFMTLVKRLQHNHTGMDYPWVPPLVTRTARLINEIVLSEETDVIDGGEPMSHFELYRTAMQGVGANTSAVDNFTMQMRYGLTPTAAAERIDAPKAVATYLANTYNTARFAVNEEVLASFLFAREDSIPTMFRNLVNTVEWGDASLKWFRLYLDRHIDLDGNEHGPAATQMLVDELQGSIPRTRIALTHAIEAVDARIGLWDGLVVALKDNAL